MNNENFDWLAYENEAFDKGYTAICGVDEAGRGPLAGPVYAAAVVLPRGCIIDGVNDSKKISEKKREMLFDVIINEARDFCIATASEKEIDELNILQATFLAMKRAVDGLKNKADFAIIDGNRMPPLDIPGETHFAKALPLRQFSQRFRVTDICLNLRKNIHNIISKSIKATVQNCITKCLKNTVPAKYTDGRF